MELYIILLIVVFVTYYLTRPTSKTEKDNFTPKIIGEVDFKKLSFIYNN